MPHELHPLSGLVQGAEAPVYPVAWIPVDPRNTPIRETVQDEVRDGLGHPSSCSVGGPGVTRVYPDIPSTHGRPARTCHEAIERDPHAERVLAGDARHLVRNALPPHRQLIYGSRGGRQYVDVSRTAIVRISSRPSHMRTTITSFAGSPKLP